VGKVQRAVAVAAVLGAGLMAGLLLTGVTSGGGAAASDDQVAPTETPLPPCVDQQYAPGTAGSGCQVRGDTTPTALCMDGSFDYSRLLTACAGHGGVYEWLNTSQTTAQPSAAAPAATSPLPTVTPSPTATPSSSAVASVGFVEPIAGASRGGTASVTVQAPPGSICTLQFTPPGAAAGSAIQIQPTLQTAGPTGQMTWTWPIPPNAPAGKATLNLNCGPAGSASGELPIT
jgi:hypothetical protein